MTVNDLIRHALNALTVGARIARWVLVTVLLFAFGSIVFSFGHLVIDGHHFKFWIVAVALVILGGGATAAWRGFSVGWFINMVGLLIVALTGANLAFRIVGPGVGALYVLVMMLLIGSALSSGTMLGYGIAPGEATITTAPSREVFGAVMLVAFWLTLTVFFIGIAAPQTDPLFIAAVLGLAIVVIPGSLYLGIDEKATRYTLGVVATIMIIMIGVNIIHSLHTLKVIKQNPVQQLWKSATKPPQTTTTLATRLAACSVAAATGPGKKAYDTLKEIYAWREKYPSPSAENLAKYIRNESFWRIELERADPKYKQCVDTANAPAPVGSGVLLMDWLKTVLYEWPWWATTLVAPLVAICLFGVVFLKGNPSDTAVDRALKLWVLWTFVVILLRVI